MTLKVNIPPQHYFRKPQWSASHFQLEFNQMTGNTVENIKKRKLTSSTDVLEMTIV